MCPAFIEPFVSFLGPYFLLSARWRLFSGFEKKVDQALEWTKGTKLEAERQAIELFQ